AAWPESARPSTVRPKGLKSGLRPWRLDGRWRLSMLSQQDNETLCRVGPGTVMGDLFRQYWLPAVRSDELPAPDSPPVRIRLLGENLIAFRATSGAVGLVADACPH